jgi:hypothetical protein
MLGGDQLLGGSEVRNTIDIHNDDEFKPFITVFHESFNPWVSIVLADDTGNVALRMNIKQAKLLRDELNDKLPPHFEIKPEETCKTIGERDHNFDFCAACNRV